MKFRKKPTVVEAEQFLGPEQRPVLPGVCLGDGECLHGRRFTGFGTAPYPLGPWGKPHVTTAQGVHVTVAPGEWIIREPEGQPGHYPCKPDIFAATYEPAE